MKKILIIATGGTIASSEGKGRSGILETGIMTIEALIAKLAWILGQTRERTEIEALFYQTINYDRY